MTIGASRTGPGHLVKPDQPVKPTHRESPGTSGSGEGAATPHRTGADVRTRGLTADGCRTVKSEQTTALPGSSSLFRSAALAVAARVESRAGGCLRLASFERVRRAWRNEARKPAGGEA